MTPVFNSTLKHSHVGALESLWSDWTSHLTHFMRENTPIFVKCLFGQRDSVQMNHDPVDPVWVECCNFFIFSCSKETHSSITPLTLERAQRSCRNKRINKQQGESPGLSLEVIPLSLSVLPLFFCAFLVDLERRFKIKLLLWFTFEHQKLEWHLIWCLFTSCVTSPWWHVHPWFPVWQDANCG